MMMIADNQLLLILMCFGIGSLGTALLFRHPAGHRVWRLADLGWVVLGGIGALVAVLAGIYKADTGRLERQIDIAYAATAAFDRDAARFRLRFCDPAYDTDIAILCEKIEFLSASTAGNAELPLFIAVTDQVTPLQGLQLIFGRAENTSEMMEMAAKADAFDPAAFTVFTALDTPTEAAVDSLRRKVPTIAGDFLILARAYDALITQVTQLKSEWEYLQDNAHILILQILALCMVAFAAPFRLGKSVVDLR
ncbi:hypothetical protein PhaeoP23_02022 [Phaeobacter piscinae]|uniref:Uncharacterized protein n=1 Tax=Phaeobacter piscinae TaxID=1580596 RepID=A0AAN1GS30_9RHOB|nr:hypothetical protein [Phaeobacter piscinae]ATG36155.1 hypothetical protein PhaeoP36_02022 [Phaeobacter piscinae]ATG43929.1 hypothetical protein PhaeoP13_02000 [Phaeobacter piscinae]AUQ86676.1 hypothetical protein PhaeoP42_02023 [Phaeobacter piscinae]AUR24559.1 hypothetical protein PhaeoP23_02022 [Phaeobacter piscinae]AUR36239.1 hypothetical protein PhaeoP18_01977 [Phaeobacter piscinae]